MKVGEYEAWLQWDAIKREWVECEHPYCLHCEEMRRVLDCIYYGRRVAAVTRKFTKIHIALTNEHPLFRTARLFSIECVLFACEVRQHLPKSWKSKRPAPIETP